MFFNMVKRNSKRERKENSLYFSSMLLSVTLFYVLLGLSQQDIIFFLQKMESQAVSNLLAMIPIFFCMTLGIMFFLIYFANKYQLDRRNHELGMYMMLGMRRLNLFKMLLLEDMYTSVLALIIGLPIGVIISEMISLITSRLFGLGIIGHRFSFSLKACVMTIIGFGVVRMVAFLLLSGRLFRKELQALFVPVPDAAKKELPKVWYVISFAAGCAFLAKAYSMGSYKAWLGPKPMAETLVFGALGTFMLFWGLRIVISFFAQKSSGGKGIGVFTFRQLQEMVAHQSNSLAVSSLLVLAAMACFAMGISNAISNAKQEHVIDYTFDGEQYGRFDMTTVMENDVFGTYFSDTFTIVEGYPKGSGYEGDFESPDLEAAIQAIPNDTVRNNIQSDWMGYVENGQYIFDTSVRLIQLSGYNKLLELAGKDPLVLKENEVAVYGDPEFRTAEEQKTFNEILAGYPEVFIKGESFHATGTVQTTDFVADTIITLSHAFIVPDEAFNRLTSKNEVSYFYNGVLDPGYVQDKGLMQAMEEVNQLLDEKGYSGYDCYLQTMGRRYFYLVSTSYITIYLGVIFLIISNTVLGVNFLMQLKKTGKRYQNIIRLGGNYSMLSRSAGRQIRWYFGLPTIVAACSSIFAVKCLMAGSTMQSSLLIAGFVVIGLILVEVIYISVVTKIGRKYILGLMEPEREE